jgi:phosphoserine phosphatase
LLKCVVFDCDGVLVDAVSSWRTLHDHYGTNSDEAFSSFLRGEITDVEFMRIDIQLWKEIEPEIHRDEIFRAFQGAKLMPGARAVISKLKSRGIYVAIVSAGVDIFVASIAAMLAADDWIANGFEFDDEGWLGDEGVVRVRGSSKGKIVARLLEMNGFSSDEVVCVGDSDIDLSMRVGDCAFIGFNPSRKRSISAFRDAGVPICEGKDLRSIWPYLFPGEDFPSEEE